MSAPKAGSFELSEVFAIVTGFAVQREAHDLGEVDFAEQVEFALVDAFEGLGDRSAIDLSAAFSVVILDLVARLATLGGETRDDLWQTVIRELTERFERRNGESE